MEFKAGNFVKVKDETLLETGDHAENWAGEILEVFPKEKTCHIALDAETLRSLSDEYLINSIEEGAIYSEYVFSFEDLMPADRRDTAQERAEALKELEERVYELEDMIYPEDIEEIPVGLWVEEFHKSKFFEQLDDYQQDNAGFIIETFCDYMENYVGVPSNEWDPYSVEEACFIAARKVTAEIELFENYGKVLHPFFEFLEEQGYLDDTAAIREHIENIGPEIVEEAADPENWGMAKSMFMGAMDAGVDLNSQEELNAYMDQLNRQMGGGLPPLDFPEAEVTEPIRKSELEKIGRNERITVRYEDGTVKENIKFKKVQQDLEAGKCTLVKK